MPIGALLGGLIAGWLVEYFGRQLSLMFSSMPLVVGWAMILVTHGIDGPLFRPLLFTGRFFTGVGAGCLSLNVPVNIKIPSLIISGLNKTRAFHLHVRIMTFGIK